MIYALLHAPQEQVYDAVLPCLFQHRSLEKATCPTFSKLEHYGSARAGGAMKSLLCLVKYLMMRLNESLSVRRHVVYDLFRFVFDATMPLFEDSERPVGLAVREMARKVSVLFQQGKLRNNLAEAEEVYARLNHLTKEAQQKSERGLPHFAEAPAWSCEPSLLSSGPVQKPSCLPITLSAQLSLPELLQMVKALHQSLHSFRYWQSIALVEACVFNLRLDGPAIPIDLVPCVHQLGVLYYVSCVLSPLESGSRWACQYAFLALIDRALRENGSRDQVANYLRKCSLHCAGGDDLAFF
jgi:hypothetical protein